MVSLQSQLCLYWYLQQSQFMGMVGSQYIWNRCLDVVSDLDTCECEYWLQST